MEQELTNLLADMCGCSICGWKGKCSDCETDWESDGWENPKYQIHLCPKCEDGGCIDDYWYSDEMLEEMKQRRVYYRPSVVSISYIMMSN